MNSATDLELINNIKNHIKPNESLSELIDRHSGIYLDMVNSYVHPSSTYVNYDDLIDDKNYKIYNAAIKFDESRGAKFSTYLGNETKWMCLNLYNRNKRRPAFYSDFIENLSKESLSEFNCDTISESIKSELLISILNKINKLQDTRVRKIFNMRYVIGSKNKVMPWKDIGKRMNLSIQGCINIHNSAIKEIKKEFSKE